MRDLRRLGLAALLALFLSTPAAKAEVRTASAAAVAPDEVTTAVLANARPRSETIDPFSHANGQGHAAHGISGMDTVVNFNGHFHLFGYDQRGNPQTDWYTNTMGRKPGDGGTTVINAPVIPVALDLRNADGTPRYVNGQRLYYDPTPYVAPVMNSPNFQNAMYSSSSTPTQLSDAIQRAEYFRQASQARTPWHTLLNPSVKATRVMTLSQGSYQFALNPDGTCCSFVLVNRSVFVNALFPATVPVDNSTPVGAAELAGDITTKDMSTFLFPNTYLYRSLDPLTGVSAGFHTFDFEPGDASNGNLTRAYVLNYSTWISPGLFAGFEDVVGLSHEIAETYNDPLVFFDGIHNITPWWLAPNRHCQDTLETADVIEGLPNSAYPITMNGMTYHPQNEALLQWFEGEKSDALHGAFSYPDETVLPSPMISQKPHCQP
jgi:hypothetical protein